ncbi:MAG TPA: hypothetical protein VFL28_06470 [bacterium]|nr:hypothetical protein [bacterium]
MSAAVRVRSLPRPAPVRPLLPWWAAAGWIAVPFAAAALAHGRFAWSVVTAAAVQGLFAVSWVLLAVSGLPSLGHALPYGAGAYTVAFLVHRGIVQAADPNGATPAALTAAAAAAGGCAGALQGRLVRNLAPVWTAAITLATVEAAHSLATMWMAPVLHGGIVTDTAIPVAALAGDRAATWITAAAFAAGVLLVTVLVRSRTGVALRAAAGADRDADALGFDAPRLRLFAFVTAGAIAGVAGALAAQSTGHVSPAMVSWQTSLFAPAAALLGGAGTVVGPAAAGYLIGGIAQLVDAPSGLKLLAFAAVLAAAGLRDPRHVLGAAFSWNAPPERRGLP